MITISNRELAEGERAQILSDFDQILMLDGVPKNNFMRFYLVADEDGQMIGFVSGLKEHKWLFLTDMWVEKTHRGKGIGSYLLKCFEEKIQKEGIQHIYLWTYGPSNPKFYEKNGYYQFALFEDYYEVEGYHQIGFRKDL